MLAPWKKSYDQPRQHIKKQTHYFANKGPFSQSYGFSSGHVWMWELDYKNSWVLKNWYFWTVVLEKTLESPLDCKEIQPVLPKGNQSWIFIGRTDAEAETPIFCQHNVKNWLIGKDPDAGKHWRQKEKGTTDYKMVGWHHWLNRHVFEQAPGVGDRGGLACRSIWSHRVGQDWATELNWEIQICFVLVSLFKSRFKIISRFPSTDGITFCLAKEIISNMYKIKVSKVLSVSLLQSI